jgi:hypothetical protein
MALELGNIIGKLAGGNKQSAPAKAGYPSMLKLVQGDAAFNTAAEVVALVGGAAGTRTRIWEFTVPAQNAYRWGFGSALAPSNQGYWWFVIADATTAFAAGTVHLAYETGTRHVYIPVDDVHDESLHSATVTSVATARLINKEEMQALPEGGSRNVQAMVGQDSRLVIDYTVTDLTGVVALDIADFNIPVTIYA